MRISLCTFLFATVVVATGLGAPPSRAQTNAPGIGAMPPGSTTFPAEAFIGRRTPGTLRSADFRNRAVHGPDDRVIGEVEDVLIGPDGRMSGLVIDIADHLGIGEKTIAVPMHAVRIDPGTTATTGTVGGLAASTVTGLETRTRNRISNVVYPDRIVLPMSLEMLRSAPAFED